MKKPTIAVIGSSSMDLVVSSDKRPQAGETVLGKAFDTVPGGKGANQAVAAARLGADVYMIGCVGEDTYGEEITANLKKNGVRTDYVEPVTHERSGTAHIILAEGDNSIVVVKGANDHVTPEYIEKAEELLKNSDLVMIQQEVPEETVVHAAELCSRYGVPLLLNPAPARPVPEVVLDQVSYVTPNEHEAAVLFGGLALSEVLQAHQNKLFITEGAAGVRYHNGRQEVLVPSFPVKAVDTTGAGDTFNAAFAVAIAEGKEMEESLRFANRAASLSVTGFGAQGGMPSRQSVEEGLES
ncbi:ribokinase [Halobacillus kuroshimensis]|uniref:Ribokinase n=1 Tax=Halobacillus kuroshimensis TaxID=302481 RepID=A0ABS3DS67_9BACI|nr:ribokinase [Halobacillus kuroshimensis]MBN8234142.1 ribokinase [Halobacillus kuroshimensis]